MALLGQCSTHGRAAEQDVTHMSLFLCHCSILLIKAALSQRVLLTTGQACPLTLRDPPHLSLPSRHCIYFHVCALKFSCCCLVFSISSTTHGFPPEPLPAHTPTEHESSWAYLDGAKHFIENAFNSGAPCGPREEKHVDKAGNLLFGFCTELLAESRPALLKPRQAVQCQASSAGRGPCASPQCGQSWGLPG